MYARDRLCILFVNISFGFDKRLHFALATLVVSGEIFGSSDQNRRLTLHNTIDTNAMRQS